MDRERGPVSSLTYRIGPMHDRSFAMTAIVDEPELDAGTVSAPLPRLAGGANDADRLGR